MDDANEAPELDQCHHCGCVVQVTCSGDDAMMAWLLQRNNAIGLESTTQPQEPTVDGRGG